MATPRLDLARRMARYEATRSVTDVLKLAERDDVVSLAGGLPDPAVFPVERIRESMERVLADEAPAALNYGPNPGYSRLREWIAARMGEREGMACGVENILVVSGGVEGINLAAMALLDEGDTVIVEEPTYMVALHVFRTYGARIVSIPMDEGGLDVEALASRLDALARDGIRPKLLYSIPSFQNPSGRTMDLARREKLVALCRARGFPILEDHAYSELVYEGGRRPSLASLDPGGVILVHTFSKIFGPGVRLGWVVAPPELIERLGLCKLGTNQCANTLTQRLVYDYGSRGHIERQVEASIGLYRRKRDRMEAAMKRYLPPEARFEHPEGGFFFWVRLGADADSERILRRAIESEKTAFVAGPPFHPRGNGANTLRLSFSFVPEARIEEGIRRLARALSD